MQIQHLKGSTSAPAIAAGAGAGSSPIVLISGDDLGGQIGVLTGTLPSTSATIATITFNVAYTSAPKVIQITPANSNTALLTGVTMVFVNVAGVTTLKFDITSGTSALTPATQYSWYYLVKQ